MKQSPCYDKVNKTDCPDRTVGCGISCKRWAEYVEKRDAEYNRRKLEQLGETASQEIRETKYLKGIQRRARFHIGRGR